MAKTTRSAPRGWTEAEWKRMQPDADPNKTAALRLWPKVLSARYDAPSQLVVLQLSNGARFGISAEKLEGVATADDDRRAAVTISESGAAIEFPYLGERFSVAELLTGVFGSRAWIAELERRSAPPAAVTKPVPVTKAATPTKSGSKKAKPAKRPIAKAKKGRAKSK